MNYKIVQSSPVTKQLYSVVYRYSLRQAKAYKAECIQKGYSACIIQMRGL